MIFKNAKIIVLLLGTTIQAILCNICIIQIDRWICCLLSTGRDNPAVQIAGEIPEPGTIMLVALGALTVTMLKRKKSRRN